MDGGGIRLYNKEGKILWKYVIPDSSYNGSKHSVSMSKDRKYIVAGNEEGNKIYFFNYQGNLLWDYEAVKSIKDVSISADGSYITFVSMDNSLCVLDFKGKILWNRKVNNISSVSISADGNSLAVGTLEKKIYFFENLQIASQRLINEAKSTISQEKSKKVIIAEAESLFTQSENAFKKGDYLKAKDFAEQARNNAIKIGKEAIDAASLIKKTKSTISQEKSKKVIIAEAESLFTQSENAFKKGDYLKAKNLAEQARSKAIKIGKEANDASLLINKAKTSIFQDEYSYINNISIEPLLKSLLSQSEDAFKKGEYPKAYLLAEKGYRLAIDIDQDGVLNKDDFAPKIKNIYIYICLVVLFLSFIITLIYINKKFVIRNKRKQYEKKLKQWEIEGYKIFEFRDKLFKMKNLDEIEQEFKKFENKIQNIKQFKKKLNLLGLEDIVKFYFSDHYSKYRKS